MTARAEELALRLADVRQRLERACDAAQRDPASLVLIAVSKGWPVDDIAIVRDLGVVDFGENRVDELLGKVSELHDLGITWHFIGQLQSKKAAAVGRTAQVVHSVDREALIAPLGNGAQQAGRPVDVLIQVSLAGMSADQVGGRGGAEPEQVEAVATLLAGAPGLVLRGVMTLPPQDVPPVDAFAAIAEISARLRRQHPSATAISAGMSSDVETAVAAGATHVRIGSALFGQRTRVR